MPETGGTFDDLAKQRAMALERIARGTAISLDDARRISAAHPIEAAAAQLQDGDVLVFHTDQHLTDAMVARLRTQTEDVIAARMGIKLTAIVMDDGMTLETIPADRLRQLGWVRADALLTDTEGDQR
jgi:hypothetical protein